MLPSRFPAWARVSTGTESIDISERRLEVASKRASQLGLPITLVQADAADLNPIGDAEFDLVFSSTGSSFGSPTCMRFSLEIKCRVLRSGRALRFLRCRTRSKDPGKTRSRQIDRCEAVRWDTGPFEMEDSIEFNWTLADILEPAGGRLGFTLRRIGDPCGGLDWRTIRTVPGTDDKLSDWNEHPRAGRSQHYLYGSRWHCKGRSNFRGSG